jgi:RNA polymerase sigma factor (sigma-70 family)
MASDRRTIVNWVALEIMPHEKSVRAWLRRLHVDRDEIDDLIQEAYCNLAGLESVSHIVRPDRYFFLTVKNILNDKYRRAKVVRIEGVAEIESLGTACDEPSPERIISARREWEAVAQVIRALPARCRRVFELRKVHGLSQKHIASQLNISESAVENEGVKGMRLILQALREDTGETDSQGVQVKNDRYRNRSRH